MVRFISTILTVCACYVPLGAETTLPVEPVTSVQQSPASCPARPSGDEVQRILQTGMFCVPMVLAVGAKYIPATQAATFAALTRGVGKLGGRIIAGMNISGGVLGAMAVAAAFGRGANSIEMCRVEGMELKRYIISETEKRGEQIQKNLEAAGFQLSEVEKRRLKFRPSYHDQAYLERRLCGEVVLHAEYMKERQNRVYLDLVNGTMKNVPFPSEPPEGLSDQDKQEIAEYLRSLKCVPAERYVQGICAIGSFVLFRKSLRDSKAQKSVVTAVRSDLQTTNKAMTPARAPVPKTSVESPATQGVAPPLVKGHASMTSPSPNLRVKPSSASRKSRRQEVKSKSHEKPLAYSQRTTTPLKPLSDRARSPQEQVLKSAVFQSQKPLPEGLTDSRLVVLSNGQKAVWKPHRKSVDSNYRAEVFAYELDQKLQLGLVPPTVEYRSGGQVGSLQLFVKGKDALERRVSDPQQEFKQSFLDYLIDHRDRHRHNFLTTDEGRFVSIDNTDSMTGLNGLRGRSFDDRLVELHVFMESSEGRQVVQRLRKTRTPQFRQEVEGYFGKTDTDKFMQRIDKVIEHFDAMIGQ